MSSDEALASRAKRLSAWQADRAALLGQADAFVVVSWWQEKSGDGRTGDYEYEHRPTLNDALDTYRDYEDGEFRRARAVGILRRQGRPAHRRPAGGRADHAPDARNAPGNVSRPAGASLCTGLPAAVGGVLTQAEGPEAC
jgi:hypothetical protein